MSFSHVDTEKAVVIRKLPDQPSNQGMNAEQLKVAFDGGATNLLQALNQLIDALNSPTAAENLGFSGSIGVPALNVQDAIENVQSQLQGISQGAVADGSITTGKLDDDAVTTIKILDNAVTTEKLDDDAVTTEKILDGAVTTAKIDDGAVTPSKLSGETAWVEIPTIGNDAQLKLEPLYGSGSLSNVKAYYCPFLGIVKLSFFVSTSGNGIWVGFGEESKYKPLLNYKSQSDTYKPAFSVLTGAWGLNPVSFTIALDGTMPTPVTTIYGAIDSDSGGGTVFASGFYYTEDIPEETEGS